MNHRSPVLLDPFVYKIDPEDYLPLSREVGENANLFREVKTLQKKISGTPDDPGAYRLGYSAIQRNQQLLKSWRNAQWQKENFRYEALRFLEHLAHYHYFFKEVGAGLKFNPLSHRPPSKELRLRMADLVEAHLPLIHPRVLYLLLDVTVDEQGIGVDTAGIHFDSRKLADFFSSPFESAGTLHSKTYSTAPNNPRRIRARNLQMILYLVTIGPGIDDAVQSLMLAGEMFDAYLLNGIGGGAAEMVAYDLNLFANDQFADDKTTARYQRFSPGYGDWSVCDQQKVFALLKPEQRIGVRLTEGDVMIPEKSTSGIMGLKALPDSA